jgi:hypothetical protein
MRGRTIMARSVVVLGGEIRTDKMRLPHNAL